MHQGGSPSHWLAHALLLLANCRRAAGDTAGAREALDAATATLDRVPGPGILPALASSIERKLLAPARRSATFGQELTGREIAVLRLLAAGLSQREAAEQLYVSYNTIKTQARTAYRKLGASTRSQAVRRARELGIL